MGRAPRADIRLRQAYRRRHSALPVRLGAMAAQRGPRTRLARLRAMKALTRVQVQVRVLRVQQAASRPRRDRAAVICAVEVRKGLPACFLLLYPVFYLVDRLFDRDLVLDLSCVAVLWCACARRARGDKLVVKE